MTKLSIAGAIAGLLLTAGPLAAQVPTPPRDTTHAADSTRSQGPARVVLLDIMIDPNVNEPYRVFLARNVVYKASFSQVGAVLQVRSYQGRQLPFVVDITSIGDPSGGTEFEIYPQADGEIEFKPLFTTTNLPVHFILWQDRRASAGRAPLDVVASNDWQVGVELQAGYHTKLSDDFAGLVSEGCIEVRRGSIREHIMSACALGVERVDATGDNSIILIFLEPRFRIWGSGPKADPPATELGFSFRFGFGELQGPAGVNGSATLMSPGLFLTHTVGRTAKDPGWTFRFSGALEALDIGNGSYGSGANSNPLAFRFGIAKWL